MGLRAYQMKARQDIHKGFEEWRAHALGGAHATKMICVQAEGCDPINQAWREDREMRPIASCDCKISGIQLTSPPDGDLALAAVRNSGGWATTVPDEETWAAQRLLVQQEGIFCEPASAAGLAAVIRDVAAGKLRPEDEIVCVLTGTGFKDANAAQALSAGVEIPVVALEDLGTALAR